MVVLLVVVGAYVIFLGVILGIWSRLFKNVHTYEEENQKHFEKKD